MNGRTLVGLNLRRLRIAKGVTQEALGLAAGCEPSYVGRIERGEENVGIDLLEALSHSLGAPLIALFAPCEVSDLMPGLRPGRKPGKQSPER